MLLLGVVPLAGCAARAPAPAGTTFRFGADTFAFENETVWEYRRDPATGRLEWRRHEPRPEFSMRCGNMARAARQFRVHARFDASLPRVDDATYARLVADVLARDPRRSVPAPDPVVVPGYPDLAAFSRDHEALVKADLGGPWASYYQRGNWRMIFPFPPWQQQAVAGDLVAALRRGELPIVHVVRYPRITVNHMLLVFDVEETPTAIRFRTYDPNDPAAPVALVWDRASRTFEYPRTVYFLGGPVKVYPVYDGVLS